MVDTKGVEKIKMEILGLVKEEASLYLSSYEEHSFFNLSKHCWSHEF